MKEGSMNLYLMLLQCFVITRTFFKSEYKQNISNIKTHFTGQLNWSLTIKNQKKKELVCNLLTCNFKKIKILQLYLV